ncbi:major facilitator superfamily transporter [Botrytis cinerea]
MTLERNQPELGINNCSSSTPAIVYLTGWRYAAVGIAIVMSMFLASLDLEFHSLNDVGWHASALFLTVAAAQSLWGKAFKCFPIKIVYVISIAVFELGSLICGVARKSTTLIDVGRAITNFGVAGTFGASYIIIGVSAPPEKRPAMTGFMGSEYAIALVIGPLIGGALTDRVSWRWCFIDLPCGALAAASIIFLFKVTDAVKPFEATLKKKLLQMDIPGFLFITAIAGSFYIFLYYLPIYFQATRGTDATGSGIRTLPVILGLSKSPNYISSRSAKKQLYPALVQIITGISVGKIGVINPFLIVGGILTTISCGLLMTLQTDTSSNKWIGYQALASIGEIRGRLRSWNGTYQLKNSIIALVLTFTSLYLGVMIDVIMY